MVYLYARRGGRDHFALQQHKMFAVSRIDGNRITDRFPTALALAIDLIGDLKLITSNELCFPHGHITELSSNEKTLECGTSAPLA